MTAKLYGVGVGPGDPELMTLKAIRVMEQSDVIVVPGAVAEQTVAYQIARGAYPKLAQKQVVPIAMPMTKDPVKREQSHQNVTDQVEAMLQAGKQVAFLTLGDPTVYSTYLYLHKRIQALGYAVEIVSGIPSFCAVAARMNVGLCEQDEMLHIIPASYDIDDALQLKGSKVLMKAASKMADVKQKLQERGACAVMIENCGMENERCYTSVQEIPDQSSYYSLIIVKEQ